MKVCSKGHAYDDSLQDCPLCGKMARAGHAAPTVYEEPPDAAGVRPAAPIPPFPGGPGPVGPGAFPFPGRSLGVPPAPGAGPGFAPPAAPAGRTVFSDDAEKVERLVGWLVVQESKEEQTWQVYRIRPGVNFIGRLGSRATIEIRDQGISMQHALLICTRAGYRLVDLDSKYGTYVNGARTDHALLRHGDQVRLGTTRMTFVAFEFEAEA